MVAKRVVSANSDEVKCIPEVDCTHIWIPVAAVPQLCFRQNRSNVRNNCSPLRLTSLSRVQLGAQIKVGRLIVAGQLSIVRDELGIRVKPLLPLTVLRISVSDVSSPISVVHVHVWL